MTGWVSTYDGFKVVEQVMSRSPYRDARRVVWILDNGSSHRSQSSIRRLQDKYPRIVQRKALTPNDFLSLQAVEEQLLVFQSYYQSIARPFQWKFTRRDLEELVRKMDQATARRSRVAQWIRE